MGEGHGNQATAVLVRVPAILMTPDIDVDNGLEVALGVGSRSIMRDGYP